MAKRLSSAAAIFLLTAALFCGCRPRHKSSAVVVSLLRNLNSPYGSELDRRILDFEGTIPRTSSGHSITIESETGDYELMLSKVNSSTDDVDLVILDKPEDAKSSLVLEQALATAPNVCTGLKACPAVVPAIIPPQINGEAREAAQKFVNFLQQKPS